MRGARVLGLLCFLGSLLCGASATVPVAGAAELEARGPAGCPDSTELRFRLERSVGVPLAQAAPLKFLVELERATGSYSARLTVTDEHDSQGKQRVLTGKDCTELADAVVVAMTLALGAAPAPPSAAPEATTLEAQPDSAPPAETSQRGEPESAAHLDSEAPREDLLAVSPLRPSLSLAALVDAGSLPDPGLGAVLGVELSWQRLQLRALATLLFEQHTDVAGGPGRSPGADLQLFTGSLLGCTSAVGGGARFTTPLCLGLELGRLSGTGTGVLSPRSGGALWAAPRADVGAQWCLKESPLCLGATLTAAAPLTRSRFALSEIGTIYRPSAVVGRLSLGIGVGFD